MKRGKIRPVEELGEVARHRGHATGRRWQPQNLTAND